MSLSDSCDDLLSSGVLQHEYGIPKLWPRTAPSVQKPDLESEYYNLNKELSLSVNRLVYMNKVAELRQTDPQTISEAYIEAFSAGDLQDMTFTEREQHLRAMISFKTIDLTGDFLTMALPVLRSIYQENMSLTDAEFTTLNNLKKLYSHYNEHPANIRRLLKGYDTQKKVVVEEFQIQNEIQEFISSELTPNLAELASLNNEYLALQNTYENKLSARDTENSDRISKKLKQASLTLSRRLQRLATLCDLLPNLILCSASNWFNDKALLEIIEDCQTLAEKIDSASDLRTPKSVDELLKLNLDALEL